jgi:hypothetical protein
MSATMDGEFSLWLSSVQPSTNPSWELMAVSSYRQDLELKSDSLRPYIRSRRLVILPGTNPPRREAES